MSATYFTDLRLQQALSLKEKLATDTAYIMIGKVDEWNVGDIPPVPTATNSTSRSVWNDMIGGKKVAINDVSLVIPKYDWTINTVYAQYDDASTTLTSSQFYVLTDDYNVYKCISNNNGNISTIKPTGTGTTVVTLSDSYKWKFMYTISTASALKFINTAYAWMPVQTLATDNSTTQWLVQGAAIPGTIDNVVVTSGGTGYSSAPTVGVEGDGSGFAATAVMLGDVVSHITVTSVGRDYTYANITLTGGTPSTDAVTRAILSPISGHGKDAELELGAQRVMVSVSLEDDENGILSIANDFREVSCVFDTIRYDEITAPVDSVIDQTYTMVLASGVVGDFLVDEIVTGNSSTAYATVVSWDALTLTLKLTSMHKTFTTSEVIAGGTSLIVGTVSSVTEPYLKPNVGRMMYTSFRESTPRAADQTEVIKVVLGN